MGQRARLIPYIVVGLLLLGGLVGYWRGWFGTIFGDVLVQGSASVDSQADFDAGEYALTEFSDGVLRLAPVTAGQSAEASQ